MDRNFTMFSNRIASFAGHWVSFMTALSLVVVWAATGPLFDFSPTWQLVINTATTVITFLMVFLIQNTQNRDSLALHLKIDELIRATEAADNALMTAEDQTDRELHALKTRLTHPDLRS